MFKHWQLYFLDVIKGKRKGLIPSTLKIMLHLPSWGFRLIVAGRNWAFDHHYLSRYFPPVPVVISIGNIVVGGTGKTPVTLMLAQEFYPELNLAILSRGYRSPAEKLPTPIMLSTGEGPLFPAAFCGDEPYLLSQNLPKALIMVGKNRHAASDMAAQAGAQIILLDDGMQHRRLARDFEIVVLDASDPFGQGYYLPRGLLREGASSLARADLLILNHVHNTERSSAIAKQLQRHTKAPIVTTKMEVAAIRDITGQLMASIKEKPVGIFCGIAQPDNFRRTVESQGAHIVAHRFFPDHLGFEEHHLVHFAEECHANGAEMLICTEKDRVKFVNPLKIKLPIVWLQMKLSIIDGQEHWKTLIENAKERVLRST